jgi:hypothetical protein
MYDKMAAEGVIPIRGDIPAEAVIELARPSKSADDAAIQISQLFQ